MYMYTLMTICLWKNGKIKSLESGLGVLQMH